MTEYLTDNELNKCDNFRHRRIPFFCSDYLICFNPIGT